MLLKKIKVVSQPTDTLKAAIAASVRGILSGVVKKAMSYGDRIDSAGKRCGKGFISVGKHCLKKTADGKILYRGKEFAGFNQPRESDRKGKKRMVLAKKGEKVKLVHYGATGYRHNYSNDAKRNYLRRSAGIKDKHGKPTKNNIFSPNYWARRDLWNTRLPADGRSKYDGG